MRFLRMVNFYYVKAASFDNVQRRIQKYSRDFVFFCDFLRAVVTLVVLLDCRSCPLLEGIQTANLELIMLQHRRIEINLLLYYCFQVVKVRRGGHRARQLEAHHAGRHPPGQQGVGRPGRLERRLLPDPQGPHRGGHVRDFAFIWELPCARRHFSPTVS